MIGWLAERPHWDKRFASAVTAMLTGSVIIYLFGLVWLQHTIHTDLKGTLEAGLYPFIVGDVLKLYLAALVLPAAWLAIKRFPAASPTKRLADRGERLAPRGNRLGEQVEHRADGWRAAVRAVTAKTPALQRA